MSALCVHRRGDDAFNTDYTPAEARLLLPYVIGLSGEFNNTSVALAATNLFIVRPSHVTLSPRMGYTPLRCIDGIVTGALSRPGSCHVQVLTFHAFHAGVQQWHA